MVVFTCNSCGDSLQKPKVAKHYQFQCRNPIFLTCVDCHKDFRGDEYTAHTKCITENERYGGKDYVQKASANKGERKQQAWLTIVQNVLENDSSLTHPERNFLNSISRHENIPRKKAKFMNFVKSACGNRINMSIVESVWAKMEFAFKNSNSNEKKEESKENTEVSSVSTNDVKESEHNVAENENNENICKENGNKTDKLAEEGGKSEKDKKKRMNESEEQSPKKKKKSEEPVEKPVEESNKEMVAELDATNTQNGDTNDNFSWKSAITEIVTSKGEISLKKLKKKMVAQYLAKFPDMTTEKATAKFEKKLGKMSSIVVTEGIVRIS